ncbi:hypothetical protein [Neptuniibacter pectenicola]|uniref:hypothetical protein n=1 Tax=Neptuniibacter pectenicola TaxID=1806669 RepID=UPI0012E8D519|nr:hypothetical protein [Neptuniibacter pectenicola]
MKKTTLTYSALILLISCSGCSYNTDSTPDAWLKTYGLSTPTHLGEMTLCHNFGCTQSETIQLSKQEMEQVQLLFTPLADSAEDERNKIAHAIGQLETITGPKLHTENDLAKNAFGFSLKSHQLDCVAESSNTSNYLLLLDNLALLKYHRVGGNMHRGLFTLHAPHNSAAIIEKGTDNAYAVDSWFRANGQDAWIVEAEQWLSGAAP